MQTWLFQDTEYRIQQGTRLPDMRAVLISTQIKDSEMSD